MTQPLFPAELAASSDGAPMYPLSVGEHSTHSECGPVFQGHSVHTLRADRPPFAFNPVDTGCIRCFYGDPFGASELRKERS